MLQISIFGCGREPKASFGGMYVAGETTSRAAGLAPS
jgi:hypothetical protein